MTTNLRPLYKHQKKVLTWAKSRTKLPLFIEMRLGKTLICVRYSIMKSLNSNLIICPKAAFDDWKKELKLEGFVPIQDIRILTGKPEHKRNSLSRNKTWYVANYESILALPEILDHDWEFMIVDESTRLKNPKTGISKLLCSRTNHVEHKAILSGHPAPESILDYFQQMKYLFNEFMNCDTYWKWRQYNFYSAGYDFRPLKKKKQKIMAELGKVSYFLTRKDAGVFRKKVYEVRVVPMDSAIQRRMYKDLLSEFKAKYKADTFTTKTIPVQVSWLCRVASGFTPDGEESVSQAKHKEIVSLLNGELKNEKVVVWFRYNKELKSVAEFLSRKFKVGMYYREDKTGVKLFKAGKLDVLCIQQKCGMVSLDLSISSTAIYFSNWWSSEMRIQSEDRILSIRKKEPLLIIDLVCENSIDKTVLSLLKNKKVKANSFARQLAERVLYE